MKVNFDMTNVQPVDSFEPLPDGWYPARVAKIEEKTTKAGTGKYYQVQFNIVDGQHRGRVVFGRYNTQNPNSQAAEIGQRQFTALSHAVGVRILRDTNELMDKVLTIRVKLKPADGQYDASNDVVGYKAAGAEAPMQAAPSPAPQHTAAPAAPAAPAAGDTKTPPPWA